MINNISFIPTVDSTQSKDRKIINISNSTMNANVGDDNADSEIGDEEEFEDDDHAHNGIRW